MESIDQITPVYMKKMDEIRMNLFRSVGEKSFVYGTSTTIVLRKEDPSKTERPIKFDFYKVEKTGNTDVLGASEPNAVQLMNSLTNFRNELAEYMASIFVSPNLPKSKKFKAPALKEFEDFDQLRVQVDDAMDFSEIADEDRKFIMDLFVRLSKHKSQWDVILLKNVPVLNAVEIISSIQFEMLHAFFRLTLEEIGMLVRTSGIIENVDQNAVSSVALQELMMQLKELEIKLKKQQTKVLDLVNVPFVRIDQIAI